MSDHKNVQFSDSSSKPTCVCLVGFGLLAGSLAASLRAQKTRYTIRAVSSAATCVRATQLKLADQTFAYDDIEQWLPGADIVLLCTPIETIKVLLKKIHSHAHLVHSPMVLSDIGSTKMEICTLGETLFPADGAITFVGGHPMAGSEKRSVEHNDPTLFENAWWILCSTHEFVQQNVSNPRLAPLRQLIQQIGSNATFLDSQLHDSFMARISHVPQLLSTALAASLPDSYLENGPLHLAGRGYRDMSRLAGSSHSVWQDILSTNRGPIREGLQEVADVLHQMLDALEKMDNHSTDQLDNHSTALGDFFTKANEVRQRFDFPRKGIHHNLHELLVRLEDKPGALSAALDPLSQAQINVLDIELLKVREGVGGTILLGFKTMDQAMQAAEVLRLNGIEAGLRQ